MREINISLFCVERRDHGRYAPNSHKVNPSQLLFTNCSHFQQFPFFPKLREGTGAASIWQSIQLKAPCATVQGRVADRY